MCNWKLKVSAIGLTFVVGCLVPSTTARGQDEQMTPDQGEESQVAPVSVAPEAIVEGVRRELGNVPDDIGAQLQEADEEIDAIFRLGPLTPLHILWDRTTGALNDASGLDLGLNYTSVYQRATQATGPNDASAGDFDFFGRWHLFGCESDRPGYLVFDSESRERYSTIAPRDLDTGTVGGTIVTFERQDFSLVQLYFERGSYKDGLLYRIGEIDPALIYDGGRFVSSNYAFLSPAFSDTLPMPLPGTSLGGAAAIYPFQDTYILAGVHDANGRRTTAGFDTFFGEGEYFTAVEFGLTPDYGETTQGLYHLTLWYSDPRRQRGQPSDRGIALMLEQQFGPDGYLVPFLRYAHAHRGVNGIRQNLSIGVGLEEVLGQNDDLIGIGFSWAKPSDRTLSDQYVFEAFYRFYVTRYTHLSPDIQVVIDPADAPDRNSVTVFGLRLRTLY